MATLVTDKLKENHIRYVRVPAKTFHEEKVQRVVTKQQDSRKSCKETEVKHLLSTLKPLHTIVGF